MNDGSIQVFEGEKIIENYLYHKNDFCSGIWNKLIKMDIIKDLEFPKGINSEDYYMYSFIYAETTYIAIMCIDLYAKFTWVRVIAAIYYL